MDDSLTTQAARQLEVVADVSARLRAGEDVGREEFERVLEQGLACLIGVRAQIRRRQVQPPALSAADAESTDGLAECGARLSDALTELRMSFDPEASSVGYGFVLPRREQRPGPPSASTRGRGD